ncbi:hypothetical protein SM0020_10735 [Sinorhizobium meliloti CCNWSX0020]|uniref:Transmembrane protein n=1 Tax=Sinorhizobium meliloti CCNWSX0020 TaxID=1107881 RepID=H0FY73_RHIML|nr:hypothetical protein SM0020_10735 [Sinorhizobium meliloti CCNWSX0020]
MFNSQAPATDDLPSSAQLARATVIAAFIVAALLVTVALPSEYGIDPTGAGSALGLAEMGEIKTQLAEEAERDRQLEQNNAASPAMEQAPQQGSSLMERIFRELGVSAAYAQEVRQDEMSLTLQPGEGAEIKLAMLKGAKANYSWTANGSKVNFDMMEMGAPIAPAMKRAAAGPRTAEFLKPPSTAITAGSGATARASR